MGSKWETQTTVIISNKCIFFVEYTRPQSTSIYLYIYIIEKYATKHIYIYNKQKKNPYMRRFFAGGSLSPGVLDRLSDPSEGAGVAIRGERLGTVGSVTVPGEGVRSATAEGLGVASLGERRMSAGLTAGERERLLDCRCEPGRVADGIASAAGTCKRAAALSPSCEF